jgi:hypothetical protein
LILDQYHQFKAIEPVSSEIVTEVRIIRDTSHIDIETPGNESAYIANIKVFASDRCLLGRAQAPKGHDDAPDSLSTSTSEQAIRPAIRRWSKISRVLQ